MKYKNKRKRSHRYKNGGIEDYIWFKNLLFLGNTITAKFPSAVFGTEKVEGLSTFTVTFIKITNYVDLGIYDAENKKEWKNSNYVYFQSNCWCCIGGVLYSKGKGFKQG